MNETSNLNQISIEEELLAPIFYSDTDHYKTTRYYKRVGEESVLHCEKGPAIIRVEGYRGWYIDGQLHRMDGPAEVWDSGDEKWYKFGKLHREDGPAHIEVMTLENGPKETWYWEGLEHRLDGPAITHTATGDEEWRQHGKLHRTDGPAITRGENHKEWWLHGKEHRVGGPAAINAICEEWWQNGQLHRVDGPAIKYEDGYEEWWVNGKLHRLDGPAIVLSDAELVINNSSSIADDWCLFGVSVTQTECEEFLQKICKNFTGEDLKQIPFSILEELYEIFQLERNK